MAMRFIALKVEWLTCPEGTGGILRVPFLMSSLRPRFPARKPAQWPLFVGTGFRTRDNGLRFQRNRLIFGCTPSDCIGQTQSSSNVGQPGNR
jgi:hypothetical protein